MILDYHALADIRNQHPGKTIVLGSGVFDLLHYGHVAYLTNLRNQGDITVIMVKSDKRVRTHKHSSRPIIPETDRVRMVDALKMVDYAFVSPDLPDSEVGVDPAYEAVFATLQPDVFYSTNPGWEKLAALNGPKIVIGERDADSFYDSTTSIIKRICETDHS